VKSRPSSPEYPRVAKIAKIQGTVTVEVLIDTDGVPISAKALNGPPPLFQASEEYCMKWRFEPILYDGKPTKARFKLQVVFKIS